MRRLTQFGPQLLLVAFGHPKQESWIVQNLPNLPSVLIAIGVGGSFDYWSDTIKRAPRWMRWIGLEWLYRLFKEPKRFGRIMDAVFVFPLEAFKDKFFPTKEVDGQGRGSV